MQSRIRIPRDVVDIYNGRHLGVWNPLYHWHDGEEKLRRTVEKERQKINSYSNADFYKYVEEVITARIQRLAHQYNESIIWHDLYGVAPEALLNTVQSILECIKSRLEVEWEKNSGTTNKIGMSTLEELMSEDITNTEHTVFYLVHKHMKTMQRIDQPITIEEPKYLKNDLVKIQDYHKEIVTYIGHFNVYMEITRQRAAQDYDYYRQGIKWERERQQIIIANRVANLKSRSGQELDSLTNAERAAQQPAQKRRRIAPNRLNIASTRGASYR